MSFPPYYPLPNGPLAGLLGDHQNKLPDSWVHNQYVHKCTYTHKHTHQKAFLSRGKLFALEGKNASGIRRESLNPGQCVKVTSNPWERKIFVCLLSYGWSEPRIQLETDQMDQSTWSWTTLESLQGNLVNNKGIIVRKINNKWSTQ